MVSRATAALAVLLLFAAQCATALEPAVLSDEEAEAEHAYLRRNPNCVSSAPAVPRRLAKVLHQMWWQGDSEPIPEHFLPLRQTWSDHHPQWTFKTWDEAAAVALINESYPWFTETFFALPSKIQKADAARYAILHAEGGVYADVDIEIFKPLDELLDPISARAVLQLFEEPANHWTAHGTVLSNGLIAAPKGHPLLLRLLESIRPVPDVFRSTGSHRLQEELTICDNLQESSDSAEHPCGCYVTHSSQNVFPIHESMRLPREFKKVGEHADAVRSFIDHLSQRTWPPKSAYSAQYWTTSWIDPEVGSLWLDGVAAAREGRTDEAEKLMLAVVWAKWAHKYQYNNHPEPPAPDRAETAYQRALTYAPSYGFAYYEMGNIALQAAMKEQQGSAEAVAKLAEAEEHFAAAVTRRNTSLLFVNNLGVTLLNQGKAAEAIPRFETVLELHKTAFATVKGLDVENGARVNLGMAFMQRGQQGEAYAQWLLALKGGSYDYAYQAVQHLARVDVSALPSEAHVEFYLGKALVRGGKTRDAALRYAQAQVASHRLNKKEAKALQGSIAEQMSMLAEVWDEGDGIVAAKKPMRVTKGNAGKPKIEIVEATASGQTQKMEVTPEMEEAMAKMMAGAKK